MALIMTMMSYAQPTMPAAYGPVPNENQLRWQEMEMYAFIHYSLNTYTDQEWGFGNEDPKLFNPQTLDCRQWARVCKQAGMRGIIFTAKHHCGFCMWPSAYTDYSVKNSPWKGGEGDVVKELAEACRAEGLEFAVYLSPWDRNHPEYGRSEYVNYFRNQLRELLTNYGNIFEVWFDGGILSPAQGGTDALALLRELQPRAIAFQGPYGYENLIRWVGNEVGTAPDPCWATADSTTNSDGVQVVEGLNGRPDAPFWCPGESDFTLRRQDSFGGGWMWHEGQDEMLYGLDELMKRYETSVGRNTNMLLGLVIDNRGLIPQADVQRASEYGKGIERRYGHPTATAHGKGSELVIKLKRPTSIDRLYLQEDIRYGERAMAWHVDAQLADGTTTALCQGTNIGHKRICTFPAVQATQLRLVIDESKAKPRIRQFAVFEKE